MNTMSFVAGNMQWSPLNKGTDLLERFLAVNKNVKTTEVSFQCISHKNIHSVHPKPN